MRHACQNNDDKFVVAEPSESEPCLHTVMKQRAFVLFCLLFFENKSPTKKTLIIPWTVHQFLRVLLSP